MCLSRFFAVISVVLASASSANADTGKLEIINASIANTTGPSCETYSGTGTDVMIVQAWVAGEFLQHGQPGDSKTAEGSFFKKDERIVERQFTDLNAGAEFCQALAQAGKITKTSKERPLFNIYLDADGRFVRLDPIR